MYDHIPTMPALRAIHDNFYPFYVFTAVRRFMFFLDPKRTGVLRRLHPVFAVYLNSQSPRRWTVTQAAVALHSYAEC